MTLCLVLGECRGDSLFLPRIYVQLLGPNRMDAATLKLLDALKIKSGTFGDTFICKC